MTRPLILVAASGLAREVAAVAEACDYEVLGFTDDDPARWGEIIDGTKVLGGLDVLADHPDVSVLICTGRGEIRAAIAARLDLAESRFATLVHPTVAVPPSCSIGPGTIVLARAVLTASVTLGRHVVVMPHVTLTHDSVVGDFATLGAGVTVGGRAHVGARAYIGMRACIRDGHRIGAGAVVGMASAVLDDVPDGEVWYGVPARPATP